MLGWESCTSDVEWCSTSQCHSEAGKYARSSSGTSAPGTSKGFQVTTQREACSYQEPSIDKVASKELWEVREIGECLRCFGCWYVLIMVFPEHLQWFFVWGGPSKSNSAGSTSQGLWSLQCFDPMLRAGWWSPPLSQAAGFVRCLQKDQDIFGGKDGFLGKRSLGNEYLRCWSSSQSWYSSYMVDVCMLAS